MEGQDSHEIRDADELAWNANFKQRGLLVRAC